MDVRDLRVFSWYFNVLSRVEKFNLIPLDSETVSRQARAFRRFRYHLLDNEDLPPGAWLVYVSFCCGRIATFVDTDIYGNFGLSYDPNTKNMVCARKIAKTVRSRCKIPDPVSVVDSEAERQKREEENRLKRARAEKRDEIFIPCDSQPLIPIDLRGCALEFGGDRFLFCPECGQFHMYRDTGWGRGGYKCKRCRENESVFKQIRSCAFCPSVDGGGKDFRTVEFIALDRDPSKKPPKGSREDAPIVIDEDEEGEETIPEKQKWEEDPLGHYKTMCMCSKDANSAGLYAKHSNNKYHTFMAMEDVWTRIAPANTARAIKNEEKFN